jgi:succinyl-CoA synthetase alpha subunit
VAFIAGEAAPEGKRMGHTGSIISADGEGSTKRKKEKLKSAGAHVVEKLSEIANMVIELPKKEKNKNKSL